MVEEDLFRAEEASDFLNYDYLVAFELVLNGS